MRSRKRYGPALLSRMLAGAIFAVAFMGGGVAHAAGKDTLVVASGAEAVTLDPGVSFDGQ